MRSGAVNLHILLFTYREKRPEQPIVLKATVDVELWRNYEDFRKQPKGLLITKTDELAAAIEKAFNDVFGEEAVGVADLSTNYGGRPVDFLGSGS